MKKLQEHIQTTDWAYVMRILKTMQSMQEDPKLAEDELAAALVKECLLVDPTLSKKISKYRAPVFDYGNFDIPSDN